MGSIDTEYSFISPINNDGSLNAVFERIEQLPDGRIVLKTVNHLHFYDGLLVNKYPNYQSNGEYLFFTRGAITEDGSLWAVSDKLILYRLDLQGELKVVSHLDSLGYSGRPYLIAHPSHNNKVLLWSSKRALVSINQKGEAETLESSNDFKQLNVRLSYIDKSNATLWTYLSDNTLWKHQFNDTGFESTSLIKIPNLNDFTISPLYGILAATRDGVYQIHNNTGETEVAKTLLQKINAKAIGQTSDGRIHLISPGYYHLYDGFKFYSKKLSNDSQRALSVDREDNIWISSRSGLEVIVRKSHPSIENSDGSNIHVLLINSKNDVKFIIKDRSLYSVNTEHNEINATGIQLNDLTDKEILNGFVDSKNRLWLWSFSTLIGINTYDYSIFYKNDLNSAMLVEENSKGEITQHLLLDGYFKYNERTRTFDKVFKAPEFYMLSAEDSEGNVHVWDSFSPFGANYFIYKEDSLVKKEYTGSYEHVYLHTIKYFYNHDLFIFKNNTLDSLFSFDKNEVKHIELQNYGIDGDIVDFNIIGQTMVLGTNKSIWLLPVELITNNSSNHTSLTKRIKKIDTTDGLPITYYDLYTKNFLSDQLNRLWLSTSKGVLIYIPSQAEIIKPKTTLRLNYVSDLMGNKLVNGNTNSISLPKGQRSINIFVSASSYNRPKGTYINYSFEPKYLLSQKVAIGNVIKLNNLKPGKNLLYLNTSFNGNLLQNEHYVLTLFVPHYLYETLPFKVLVFIALIFVIGWSFYRREQLQIEKNITLEREVAERTKEIVQKNALLEHSNSIIKAQASHLEQQEKLKSNLYATISHELRTPITLIKGPLQRVLSRFTIDSEATKELELCQRNVKRLEKLTNQLLDVTRIEGNVIEPKIQTIDLHKRLSWLLESFNSYASFIKIEMSYNPHKEPIYVKADLDLFDKVMYNLISNALKFTPQGGTVTISTELHNETANVIVSDTGIGIDKDDIHHIFNQFYKVSQKEKIKNREGVGIGLFLSKELMNLMNGSIVVSSAKNEGSTFTATFPIGEPQPSLLSTYDSDYLLETQPKTLRKSANTRFLTQAPNANILVVDDNPDMLEFVTRILQDTYFVKTASNGLEALKILSTSSIHLIITDYMMPHVDGLKLTNTVRSRAELRKIPIIMLTALNDETVKIKSFDRGINDYVVKPFDEVELLARVKSLLKLSSDSSSDPLSSSPMDAAPISHLDEFVTKVLDFVQASINQPITVEDIATHLNTTSKQVTRNLKRATGMSTIEFVREVKLQKARRLLESGAKTTVAEVMQTVGWQHQHHFTKLYVARFGKKPSSYFA